MADQKLDELTALPAPLTTGDLLYVVRSGVDYKAASTDIVVPVGQVTGLGTGVATALAVNVGSSGAPVVNGGALGTPSSGTLTNASGLPIGGVTGLGTGVATALAINVGSSGAPVVLNGALGTPSSGTLTNATGLPVGGITGLGTGVATALAVNVGSAGAPVVLNGALGTPSSGTLTNATGLPEAGLSFTDLTTANATTTVHGLLMKATAAAAGTRNALVIDNGETTYKNAALFDTTNPADLGAVSPGSSLVAARRDHVHAAPGITSITGLGTGVATALAVNVGSSGAPVVLNGALGTPTSGTLTNCGGTAKSLTAGNVPAFTQFQFGVM